LVGRQLGAPMPWPSWSTTLSVVPASPRLVLISKVLCRYWRNLLSRSCCQSSFPSALLFCCSAPHISGSFSLYLRFILTSLRPMQVERLLVTYRSSMKNCADQILGSNANIKTKLECCCC
jgi:hypothetical protein